MTVLGALVFTGLSGLATSSGMSGTLVRTQCGAPHFFVTVNVDPNAPDRPRSYAFHPAYFAMDACFWGALGIATVVAVSVMRRLKKTATSPAASKSKR